MSVNSKVADATPFRYCGRTFTEAEIEIIRGIAEDPWHTTRAEIARAVCEALHWLQADGHPKLASCQVALRRMEAHGVIWLPLPTQDKPGPRPRSFSAASEPGAAITGSRGDLAQLRVRVVQARSAESRLWKELMARHHYLGDIVLPGAQVRYLAYDGDRVLAALGFAAAAWKVAPRDRFIGWTVAEREAHLGLVVNNHRFLVLPWVQVRFLASSLLAQIARRLPDDWQQRHAYRPALLETFVEEPRFRGTAYAAANWIRVGQTQGRGKLDRAHRGGKPAKGIWLYPLDPRFRTVLTDGRLPAADRGMRR